MKLIHLPLMAVIAGIVLIGLSFAWPSIVGTTVWSEQQARERSEAWVELHELTDQHAHATDHVDENNQQHKADSLKVAKERYERSRAGLERARSLRRGTATFLKWAGVLCSVLGAAGYFLALRSAAG